MRFVYFLILCFLASPVFSQVYTLSGKITDNKNNGLSFASVMIKGTTIGTTGNADGLYTLKLKPGHHEIVFQYVGYKKEVKSVNINSDINLNVILSPENYELKEVVIKAGEDPAYEVIRQAIKKRKFYLNQVNAYSCRAYIKGLQRMSEFPKNLGKILKATTGENGLDSSMLGVIYLSESESKFHYKKPNDEKEIMFSSKVSGDNKTFSFNQLSDMKFNFYENLVTIDGLSDRPFISPINENAFLSYRYRLLGVTYEDGKMINKIQVMPKRKNDPCFNGIIYITENSWRIHSIDMYLTKDAKIDFVDTLRVKQLHASVKGDTLWMPVSYNFSFDFKFMGFKGNGYFNAVISDYEINPVFPKKFFKNEVLKVEEEANKKDTAYWKDTRPIPLTKEETDDYRKKDSIAAIKNSKGYKDSIDKKANKFKINNLLMGYRYQNSYKKYYFSTSGLLTSGIQYNTVEGLNTSMNFNFEKSYENYKRHNIDAGVRYGFSNYLWGGKISWRYLHKPQKIQQFGVTLQSLVNQYNSSNPITESVNSAYTLYLNDNFMKLYKKTAAKFFFRTELVNGVHLNTNIEYASRSPLRNSTDKLIRDNPNKLFTSNDPLFFYTDDNLFSSNNAFIVEAFFTLRYKLKYYTLPYRKIIIGSKYPHVNIGYRKAIPVLGATANYDLALLSVEDDVKMGLFGTFSYRLKSGYFLNNKNMYFMDYKHFNGNQTVVGTGDYLNAFKLLPYYTYSTNKWYVEAHAEHHFNGFIFNKLPYIKKTKLHEVVGGHALFNDKMDMYYEINFGIENIFSVIRVDYVLGYGIDNKVKQGFLIKLALDL